MNGRSHASRPHSRKNHVRPHLESLEDRHLLAAGVLDPTLAGDGMLATNFKLPDSYDQAWDVAVYPGGTPAADGKIVAEGTSLTRILQNGTWDHDFGLARYNPDGSLDGAFGQGGKVTTALGASRDYAFSVELVGNKILAAGYAEGKGFALARYNDNGSLDTSFGNQGKVLTSVSGGGVGLAMKVDSSGKIVMAGTDAKGRLALVRYTANGALDKTFGKNGIAVTALSASGEFGRVDMAFVPATAGSADAGRIVVVGVSNSLLVTRFTTAGLLDTSFASAGVLAVPATDTVSLLPAVAIQNDGRIVVAYGSDSDIQVLRLHSNGAFDASFDGDGKMTTSRPGTQFASSVALQSDGKILVAGDEYFPSSSLGGNFFMARISAAGALDDAFGSGGVGLSTENTLPRAGRPNVEIAVQENGKLIVAGRTDIPTGSGYVDDFAVARFTGDAALHAAMPTPSPVSKMIDVATLTPLVGQAIARWQAAGVDVSALANIDARIADLGGATLGLASGSTIWLDDNAAGWGWFVDRTPGDDLEFVLPGNQGEQNHMDLLTVVMHELGHLLGHDHKGEGVMAETLAAGVRRTGLAHDDAGLAEHVFGGADDYLADAWLAAWAWEQFESTNARAKRRG